MKSIAILGTGDTIREFDFKADEVWGVNGAYTIKNMFPVSQQDKVKMDKLFMTDFLWSYEGNLNFHIGDLHNFSRDYHCELISLHKFQLGKHVLKAKRYPYEKIRDYFSTEYFTDTITYMIAYALYTHSKNHALTQPIKLRLYGVDMCTNLEYLFSKGGIEFWLGMAMGMGCEVEVSKGSAIMAHPRGHRYGVRPKLDIDTYDPFNILQDKKRRPLTGAEKIARLTQSIPDEGTYQEAIK